jgi:histidine triad (HIT) family protein
VIPKHAQARNLLELDADNLACLFLATQRIARAVVAAVQLDGIQIFQFNGGHGGQSLSPARLCGQLLPLAFTRSRILK